MSDLTHQELSALVSAYALGAADPDDAASVEAHLLECEECRRELAVSTEVASMLALALPVVEPPAHLRSSIVMAAGADRELTTVRAGGAAVSNRERAGLGARLSRLLTPARALAVAATACAVVAIGVAVQEHGTNSASAIETALQARGARVHELSAADSSTVRVITAPGHRAVFVGDMPTAPDGHTFQLWAIPAAGRPVSLGLIGNGSVARTIRTVAGTKTYAVTVEPADGSAQPTTKPVMVGSA